MGKKGLVDQLKDAMTQSDLSEDEHLHTESVVGVEDGGGLIGPTFQDADPPSGMDVVDKEAAALIVATPPSYPTPTNPNLQRLSEAVETLLSYLPPAYAHLLDVISVEHGRPRAVFVLSQLQLCFERGDTSFLLPDYTDLYGEAAASFTVPATSVCGACGKSFQPARVGQLFCSNACGGRIASQQYHQHAASPLTSNLVVEQPVIQSNEQLQVYLRAQSAQQPS